MRTLKLRNILVFGALASSSAFAQSGLLPEGVGLYQYGYRSLADQSLRYDEHGDQVPLGAKFNKNLTGARLLDGSGGAELKRLASELAKYGEGANLVNSLDLGTVKGDVKADVSAQIFGLGYGLSRKWTLFLGIPWVSATVLTEITHEGNNNADAIGEQLGGLAFAELADGLQRASEISASQIQDSIEAAGYAPIDKWSHSGPGDLKIGTKTAFGTRMSRSAAFDMGLTLSLDAPTGYVEDADILTDVSFGKGYYSLALGSVQRFVFAKTFVTGFDAMYAENLPTTAEKRVPEGEEDLVAADRKTTVDLAPGDDTDVGTFLGLASLADGWIDSTYRVGSKRHFSDQYSGTLAGNYQALAKGTSSYQTYQELSLSISSVKSYRRKQTSVPFILTLKAHHPIEARNSADERYYEAQIASFFSTPAARDDATSSRRRGSRRSASH